MIIYTYIAIALYLLTLLKSSNYTDTYSIATSYIVVGVQLL